MRVSKLFAQFPQIKYIRPIFPVTRKYQIVDLVGDKAKKKKENKKSDTNWVTQNYLYVKAFLKCLIEF